jgi:hypothetical protein
MVGLVCRQPPFSKIRTRFSSNFSTGISEGCLPFFLFFFFYFLLSSRGCCVYTHTTRPRAAVYWKNTKIRLCFKESQLC